MNQLLLGIVSAAPLLLVSGCTSPAHFKTSDAPPSAMMTPEPLTAYVPPVANLPSSRTDLQKTSERFFLALEIRSSAQLGELLTADAMMRRQASGANAPALAGLIELSSAWSPSASSLSASSPSTSSLSATAPTGPAPSRTTFGPITFVEMQTNPTPAWVTVDVAGPPQVQGRWKMRFDESGQKPLIQEVVLPQSR